MNYKEKYLKYKRKYFLLKYQLGGMFLSNNQPETKNNSSSIVNIKDMIKSDNKYIIINGDIIRSLDFTKSKQYVNDKEELVKLNYDRFRSLFTKHIFKRYSEINLQSDKINLILTTLGNGGYGDFMALYKLYKILNNFQKNKKINQNVRLVLFLPMKEDEVKRLLANELELSKKIDVIHSMLMEQLKLKTKVKKLDLLLQKEEGLVKMKNIVK